MHFVGRWSGDRLLAGANRVRLLLEASERRVVGEGALLVSTAEMGLRHDGGDADTGTGVEVGAGSRYVNERYGLSTEGTLRWLMVHNATEFGEWGVGISVLYEPGGAERGASLRMSWARGVSEGGAEALWSPQAGFVGGMGRASPVSPAARDRFAARVQYAISPFGDGWSTAPYAEIGYSDGSMTPESRVGWSVNLLESMKISLETGVGPVSEYGPRRGITLRGWLGR